MASINRATIIGNLGRDPEIRYSAAGVPVCNITVATSSTWKDKDSNERKSETEWHSVVFYRQLAEIVGKHLHKGSLVYIAGRLKTRKWQNKEGQDRYTTEIIADELQMLDGKPDGEKKESKKPSERQEADEITDDIPF